jgi:hypothetical protein
MNEAYVEKFAGCLASHIFHYLRQVQHYSARCCSKLLTNWFEMEEALQAEDAKWDDETYAASTLRSMANQSYDKDMEILGMVDIAPELLAEMKRGSSTKQHFDTEAMQRVADRMQLKEPTDGENFSQIDSTASALSDNTHTTNGQDSTRSVTSETVQANLSKARVEFRRLCITLREMCPEHTIFEESTFVDNVMETGSFGSNKSEELQKLYRETRASSFRLRACINEIEQSASSDRQQTGNPLPSGSAAPPQAQEPQRQTGEGSGAVQGS